MPSSFKNNEDVVTPSYIGTPNVATQATGHTITGADVSDPVILMFPESWQHEDILYKKANGKTGTIDCIHEDGTCDVKLDETIIDNLNDETIDMIRRVGMDKLKIRPTRKSPAVRECGCDTGCGCQGEEIKGGIGDYRPDEEFDPEQLRRGTNIEMEHTNDPDKAKEIAKDHLTEDPTYYLKLMQIDPHN
jgi:hypothetical protein